MAPVHDFPENVFKIVIGNDFTFGQVIVLDVRTNSEVPVVEVVSSRPPLSPEFLSSQNHAMEIA